MAWMPIFFGYMKHLSCSVSYLPAMVASTYIWIGALLTMPELSWMRSLASLLMAKGQVSKMRSSGTINQAVAHTSAMHASMIHSYFTANPHSIVFMVSVFVKNAVPRNVIICAK